MIKSIYFF